MEKNREYLNVEVILPKAEKQMHREKQTRGRERILNSLFSFLPHSYLFSLMHSFIHSFSKYTEGTLCARLHDQC